MSTPGTMPSGTAVGGEALPKRVAGGASRSRKWWVIASVVVVGLATGGWAMAANLQSSNEAAARADPPVASWITADVERRVLARTVITRGDVRPEVSVAVAAPSSIEGEPVVTAIGVAAGDEVAEGARVVEVSGRPVFALQGAVPVYRTLKPAMTGADVAQLKAALGRLGCDASGDGAVYGEATKACVARFYADAGYEPTPSSETEKADLAGAEQVLAEAESALEQARLALATSRKGPTSSELLGARTAVASAQRAYDDAVASADAAIFDAQRALDLARSEVDRLGTVPDSDPADLSAARTELAAAEATLGQAQRSAGSSVANAADAVALAKASLTDLQKAPDVAAQTAAVAQATDASDRARTALAELRTTSGAIVPQGEVVFVPTLPARAQRAVAVLGPVSSGDAQSTGGEGQAESSSSGALVDLAAGQLVVSMTARAGERELLRPQMAVELLDEQADARYPGKITRIAETAALDASGQLGFAVLVTPDQPLPADLAGVNLRITITAASTEAATLVVPIAAVSSAADGSTNVSILPAGAPPRADPTVVAVKAGLSADGFVAVEPITPGTLSEGDRVVVGR